MSPIFFLITYQEIRHHFQDIREIKRSTFKKSEKHNFKMGKMSHLTTTELFSKDEQMFPKFASIKGKEIYPNKTRQANMCGKFRQIKLQYSSKRIFSLNQVRM